MALRPDTSLIGATKSKHISDEMTNKRVSKIKILLSSHCGTEGILDMC